MQSIFLFKVRSRKSKKVSENGCNVEIECEKELDDGIQETNVAKSNGMFKMEHELEKAEISSENEKENDSSLRSNLSNIMKDGLNDQKICEKSSPGDTTFRSKESEATVIDRVKGVPKFQTESEEIPKPKIKTKKKQRSILKNRNPNVHKNGDEENEVEYQPSAHVIQSVKNWLEKGQDDISSQTSDSIQHPALTGSKIIRKSKSFKADDGWINKKGLHRTGIPNNFINNFNKN